MIDAESGSKISFCNSCRRDTAHDVLKSREFRHEERDDVFEYSFEWGSTWYFLECRGCEAVSLREESWHSEMGSGDDLGVQYFPPRVSRAVPEWVKELPETLSSLLNEIYAALHADSRRLATMGIRAAFDLYIVGKVGDVGSFAQKLKALEDNGHVVRSDREILEAALDLGSAASHRAHSPQPKELSYLVDILESVLHRETLGRKVKLIRDKTPSRKLAGDSSEAVISDSEV